MLIYFPTRTKKCNLLFSLKKFLFNKKTMHTRQRFSLITVQLNADGAKEAIALRIPRMSTDREECARCKSLNHHHHKCPLQQCRRCDQFGHHEHSCLGPK
jgi:hypothetical protein